GSGVSLMSPMIIGAWLASLDVVQRGHRGRPWPFGSPVRAKFTQYDDTLSASARSDADADASSGELASGNTRGARRWLKTYGISTVCVAFRFRAFGAWGGACAKKYQYARVPRFACRPASARSPRSIWLEVPGGASAPAAGPPRRLPRWTPRAVRPAVPSAARPAAAYASARCRGPSTRRFPKSLGGTTPRYEASRRARRLS